ncbi:MAG: DnaA/Hda family protein [bacterium]|nr:DnaA/Hda family protein [bacterium]
MTVKELIARLSDLPGDLLCVFGANGAGKTRLLRSIEQCLPEGDVSRVGTETLIDDLVRLCSQFGRISEWRRQYSTVDVLMLDNFWCLADRPATAKIICHLIRDRRGAGKLTAVASDLPLATWKEKNREIARLLREGTAIRLT